MTAAPDLLLAIVAATERLIEVRREREPAAAVEKRAAVATPDGARFEKALGAAGAYQRHRRMQAAVAVEGCARSGI